MRVFWCKLVDYQFFLTLEMFMARGLLGRLELVWVDFSDTKVSL